jgi:N-acyl-D-amino-acid deacylase
MKSAFVVVSLLGIACGGRSGSPSAPDAGPGSGTDAGADATTHTSAQLAACETSLAAAWAASPPTTGLGSASARASYEQVIGKIMSDYQVPGGAVAVSKNGQLVLALGLGMQDVQAAQPAHPDELFRMASLSKQITATAILHLVGDGQLSLDDRVFDILTGYTPVGGAAVNPQLATITIRNLLNHTGGWNRNSEAVGDPMFDSQTISAALGQPGPADTDMIIQYMLDKPLTYAPGTTYCYSNFGYALLGRVIARVSGMTYNDYVQSNVLAPAGVTDMVLGHTLLDQRADHEVRYYGYPNEPLAPSSVFPGTSGPVPWEYGGWYIEAMESHGAWVGSPMDLLRFQLTIDQKPSPADQLSTLSEAAMVQNPNVPTCNGDGSTTPANANYWYGFGLQVNSSGNFWHTGSLDGTSTEDVIAGNGYSWSVFFNTRPAPASSGAFSSRVDGDLWTALSGAGSFGTTDLFTQYPDYSAWTPASTFSGQLSTALASGMYPSRLEGEWSGSAASYRARFASAPPGRTPDVVYDADCVDYTARDAAALAAGSARVSIQSYDDGSGVRRYQAVWMAP